MVLHFQQKTGKKTSQIKNKVEIRHQDNKIKQNYLE